MHVQREQSVRPRTLEGHHMAISSVRGFHLPRCCAGMAPLVGHHGITLVSCQLASLLSQRGFPERPAVRNELEVWFVPFLDLRTLRDRFFLTMHGASGSGTACCRTDSGPGVFQGKTRVHPSTAVMSLIDTITGSSTREAQNQHGTGHQLTQ
jgi:hypothetical protein